MSDGYELPAALAAAVHLASSRPRTAATSTAWRWRTASRAMSRRSPIRRGRRLARPARRRRHRHRCRRAARSLLRGLSMPHSPRLHDGRLWLLNSGTGELGFHRSRREHIRAGRVLPGLCARPRLHRLPMRSSASRSPRENRTFQGLPLDAALAAQRRRAALRAAGGRHQDRRHRRVAAHRGRGARAVTTSRCCPAYATRPRSASRPTRSSA